MVQDAEKVCVGVWGVWGVWGWEGRSSVGAQLILNDDEARSLKMIAGVPWLTDGRVKGGPFRPVDDKARGYTRLLHADNVIAPAAPRVISAYHSLLFLHLHPISSFPLLSLLQDILPSDLRWDEKSFYTSISRLIQSRFFFPQYLLDFNASTHTNICVVIQESLY